MRSPWGDIGWSPPSCVESDGLGRFAPRQFLLRTYQSSSDHQVTDPFEPLESASELILTLKVTLLLALTSLKRVGDLQALSVSEMCMDFAPGLVKVTLRPGTSAKAWFCNQCKCLVTFPRSCPHRFALRWSHFTLSILLPLP